MYRYILHRLLLLFPTLLGILAITFAVIQFVPGGPVEQMVQQLTHGAVGGETATVVAGDTMKHGNRISPEDLAALNALYGFDKPPLTRFADMVWRFARFDLGKSFSIMKPCSSWSNRKMPVSMSLGLWTFFSDLSDLYPVGHCQGGARRQPF